MSEQNGSSGNSPTRSDLLEDSQMWSDVSAEWLTHSRDGLWRAYNDKVTCDLIANWLPERSVCLLKTDLFDEVVSAGLFPKLEELTDAVYGIDIAAEAVTAVSNKYPNLIAKQADVRSLPFEDNKFDAVVSTSTLDHFDNEQSIHQSLMEIRRVMAFGGRLLITLDNPQNPKLALRAALPEHLLIKAGLMRYPCGVTLSPDAFSAALQQARFEVLERKAFLHCPRVTGVKLAALVQRLNSERLEKGLTKLFRTFEHLEQLPTRWKSAHFTALLARAC